MKPWPADLSYLTDRELRSLADEIVAFLDRSTGKYRTELFDRIEKIRDEMSLRVDPRDDGGASGVREPRRPLPGGSSAAAVDEGN